MIYKATGNLPAIQILLGPAKIENMVRYLGVDIDALVLADYTEVKKFAEPYRAMPFVHNRVVSSLGRLCALPSVIEERRGLG
ncbi:integrase [Brucella sp. ZJ1_1]|uniref:Uncharacterized protein n=5 Tax=Brucella intermedia TaxID=94625 RepID=U4VAC2_9HYPH|nr:MULTISPECIES: hypothetical protein [Brucella]ERM02930.1 hypothetical protein Q644_14215 [Brucella intermedia 229E]ELT48170.1 hypothetical protein D584_15073 [Brucella intermedia M86]MBA8853759.1 hypothetical protein [Brucella intermedia]MCH6205377.1 integrase [Brucella ciceri]MDH0124241.1 integrase [Brucella intermedia GD04153]